MKRTRVLHISYGILPGGGPHGYLYNLKKGYENLLSFEPQHRVSLSFWPSSNLEDRQNMYKFINIWSRRLLNLMPCKLIDQIVAYKWKMTFKFYNKKLEDLLSKIEKSDIIVFHSPLFAYMFRTVKDMGKRLVYMQHSPTAWSEEVVTTYKLGKPCSYNKTMMLLKEIENQLFSLADNIILPSEHSVDAYETFFPGFNEKIKSKAIYVSSGVSKPKNVCSAKEVREKLGIGPERFVVLYVGRYHSHKGFDIFLETVRCAADIIPDILFMCMGAGPLKPNEMPNLINLGWQAKPHDFIAAADVLMLPNRFTYFDLVALEAISLGTIILASPVGGNLDLKRFSKGVLLADENNPISYIDKVRFLRGNKHLRNELSRKNIDVYNKFFNLTSFARRHLLAFECD